MFRRSIAGVGLVLGVALALAGVALAAASAKRPAPVNWARLHRPMIPLALAGDGGCPTTAAAATVGDRPIIGRYPVFLFIVGDAGAGEIKLGPKDATGWRGQKTPWLTDVRYRGPILIRAEEVGGTGPVAFANVSGQHLAELRYIAGTDSRVSSDVGTYHFRPGTTMFREAGCYVFQVDGKHFTRQIVVRVSAS